MRKALIGVAVAITALAIAGPAWAGFGLTEEHGFEVSFTNENGTLDTQAGSHPFAYTTTVTLNEEEESGVEFTQGGNARDIEVELFPGLVGDPGAVPACTIAAFDKGELSFGDSHPCPDDTQIGVIELKLNGFIANEPIYNLSAPKGAPAEFGFIVLTTPVVLVPPMLTP